ELSRNERYGGKHVAYLDKITLRYINDFETANNAFRTGEVDMAPANVAALDVLKSEFGDRLVMSAGAADTQGLAFNLGVAPLDNTKMRLALSQAINRELLVK